jgi:hypothetical protein
MAWGWTYTRKKNNSKNHIRCPQNRVDIQEQADRCTSGDSSNKGDPERSLIKIGGNKDVGQE